MLLHIYLLYATLCQTCKGNKRIDAHCWPSDYKQTLCRICTTLSKIKGYFNRSIKTPSNQKFSGFLVFHSTFLLKILFVFYVPAPLNKPANPAIDRKKKKQHKGKKVSTDGTHTGAILTVHMNNQGTLTKDLACCLFPIRLFIYIELLKRRLPTLGLLTTDGVSSG